MKIFKKRKLLNPPALLCKALRAGCYIAKLLKRKKLLVGFLLIVLISSGLYFAFSRQEEKKSVRTGARLEDISNLPIDKAPELKLVKEEADKNYSYSFKMAQNVSAYFESKKEKSPSFKVASSDGKSFLEFTLGHSGDEQKEDSRIDSGQARMTGDNIIEYDVKIQGIPMVMRLTSTEGKVKEEFIIKEKPSSSVIASIAKQSLVIPFSFNSQGLEISEKDDCDVIAENVVIASVAKQSLSNGIAASPSAPRNDRCGKMFEFTSKDRASWSIPKPSVEDAKGTEGTEGTIKHEILRSAQNDNKYTYSLILDSKFLENASYPVTIDPTVTINTSSTTTATQVSMMKNIVRTSDGTLHSFVQVGTQTATCGGSKSGLLWFNSTDSGATWTCQGQLSSDTTNLMYPDVRADTSDNIYVVYSVVTTGRNNAYDVFYQKLTKGAGATWTLETAQTVLDGSGTGTAYAYSVIELQGTTRAWIATRYYDGTNYGITVYDSNNLAASPTWTQSVAAFNTAGNSSSYHYPTIVRFGSSKIGIIWSDQSGTDIKWRFRDDSDGLTSWSTETEVWGFTSSNYSAIGHSNGKIYIAFAYVSSIYFAYFNGYSWSNASNAQVTSILATGGFISLSTDGTNVWVYYGDTSGLSSMFVAGGVKNLVYKKGIPPFRTADFDSSTTSVVSYHSAFDKYWSYVSSAYTDDTTDAGDTDSADTQMLTSADNGDIVYFGKTEKFDSIVWDLSTNGAGGTAAWEYCSAVDGDSICTAWSSLSFTASSSNTNFVGDGWGAFTAPSDWAANKVNTDSSAYYYIRARATANYTQVPVGVQILAKPSLYWGSFTPSSVSNTVYGIWTENPSSQMKVRFASVSLTTSSSPSSTSNISPSVVAYSTQTTATSPSTQTHIVRTSDGTLHAFVQGGEVQANGCTNAQGLLWLNSTDSGSTWTCQGQLSSDTTNLMYADVRADTSDNIYAVYSIAATGRNDAYDVFYRKLTKGAGATWTLETAQTLLDGSGSGTAYGYAVIELQSTTRAWIATRYYDGTNYGVTVYYSDGLTAAPTWTQSVAAFDTAGTNSAYHYPTIVRFGTKIGIIWNDQSGSNVKWRYRDDSDGLTSWAAEAQVVSNTPTNGTTFSAVGDTNGKVYFAYTLVATLYFSYFNGISWSSATTAASGVQSSTAVSISADNTNVWIFFQDATGLSGGLPGDHKLVYKKGVPPFSASDFSSSTSIISTHTIFDKYWSYVSSVYTDDTTDAGDTDSADTQMVTGVGDIAYFGKSTKFDSVSWDNSTNGAGGSIIWEYWNGTSWMQIADLLTTGNSNFTADGYISFIPHTDWATTAINGEGTSYYYVRARVTTAFSTTPVGIQVASIAEINWQSFTQSAVSDTVYGIWTENGDSAERVRFSSVSLTTSSSPSSTSNLSPVALAYSSTSNATQVSTQRHIVRTSDGTLHAFVQGGTVFTNGCTNSQGLLWINSTDGGSTWTCRGQLSSDTTNLMYADARVDSSDNIYIVYSVVASGRNNAYDVFYRKLTKGAGATWTLETAQTVLDGSGSGTAYAYSVIEVQSTTRAWIATRYYNGTNYGVTVYYSDGLTASPTWTESVAALDTAGTSSVYHYPLIVRFGTKIGIIYNDQGSLGDLKWRYRDDSDGLTTWADEATINANIDPGTPVFSTVGAANGYIYLAANDASAIEFTYYNGSSWSTPVTVSSAAAFEAYVGITVDNNNVWVFYGETTGLSSGLQTLKSIKLVYKKGITPYASGNFDTNSTAVVSYHGTFDKYWSYVSSAYLDDTTDAGNSTNADTQMVTGVGDIMYFGKTVKFDSIAWDVSTSGVGGAVVWEYWNGSNWMQLTDFLAIDDSPFTADGYISFIPHTDWATTTVNGEATSYYYVRARATTAYSTSPVGVQIVAIPQVYWTSFASDVAGGLMFGLWTENAAATTKVRFTSMSLRKIQIRGGTKFRSGSRINLD